MIVRASILSTLHICGGESGYIEVFSWPLHASRTLYSHECAYYSGSMNSKLLAGRLGRCLGKSSVLKWSTKAVLQQHVLSATLGFLTVEKKTASCVASVIRLQAAYRRPSVHTGLCHSYDGCHFTSQSNSIEVFPLLTCSMYKFSQLFFQVTLDSKACNSLLPVNGAISVDLLIVSKIILKNPKGATGMCYFFFFFNCIDNLADQDQSQQILKI